MNEENTVQINFELGVDGLKQQLSESEALMAAGVQRMNALQQGETPTVITSPQGAPPPVPPPPVPTPPTGGSAATAPPPPVPPSPTSGSAVTAAQEELEQIRQLSAAAPDVALAALSGRGGLLGRVQRGAIASPDQAEEYQELLEGISELTKSIRANTRQAEDSDTGGPAAGLLGFLRQNAIAGMAGNIGGQIAGGNVIGAGAQALGGALGFIFGGPAGAMAGATVGAMGAGAATSILGLADENLQFQMEATDITARFGAPGEGDTGKSFSFDSIASMENLGYSTRETVQLFDTLRQGRLSEGADEESRELVTSIQELSRALGLNTQAIAESYSNYRTLGGEGDLQSYQAQVIAGAVATGMRANLEQYSEILNSARMQIVYQGGIGDDGDGGLRGIQGTMALLVNQQNRVGDLLRDNPMMMQMQLANFLSTGSSRSLFGSQSSLMQLAGVNAAHTTEGYISPERRVQNALQVHEAISRNFLQQATGIMGFENQEQVIAAAQANPNLIQDLLTDRNPNTRQARALQEQFDVQTATMLGKPLDALTGQDRQLGQQLLQGFLSGGGELKAETIVGDGQKVAELIAESQKTEAQKTREAEEKRHREMMKLWEEFRPILISFKETSAEIAEFLRTVVRPAIADIKKMAEALAPVAGPIVGGITGGAAAATRFLANPQETVSEEVQNFVRGQLPSLPTPVRQSAANAAGNMVGVGVNTLLRLTPFEPAVNLLRNAAQFFDDTPTDGVLVEPGRETFSFAPGDRVYAAPDLSRMAIGGAGGQSINATVNVNLAVPAGADAEWVRGAAQSGAQSGLDKFMVEWANQNRQVNPRQPRSAY